MKLDKQEQIAERMLMVDPKIHPDLIVKHIQRSEKARRPETFKSAGALATKVVLKQK